MSADPREPVLTPPLSTVADPAAEAGCANFESTLLLMDGELSGDAETAAKSHADGCATCGPMVRDWSRVQVPMVAMYESVAERAKPDLAGLADRVLAAVPNPNARQVVVEQPSFAMRLFGSLQAWLALGAVTAALVLIVPPLLQDAPVEYAKVDPPVAVTPVVPVTPIVEPAPVVTAQAEDPIDVGSPDEEPANDALGVVVRHVEFEGADGMVFRAPESDTTVIWVNEFGGT